jgi:SAM-dependent methyltransferase/ribosomal protein S18 acetylase RimI-like enzyme
MDQPASKVEAPLYELREIDSADKTAVARVAQLHMELLGFGPLAGLGAYFIREIGYRRNLIDGLLRVALYEVAGQPAGFVAYTHRSITFHRSALRRHWLLAAWTVAVSLLREPWRLARLLRAVKVILSRRGETVLGEDPLGEVVAIAVRREYLVPEFVRQTGAHVAEQLVQHTLAYFRRAGVDTVRMLVDADNKSPLLLYHRLGARFEPYEQAGEPMVHVWFDLTALPGAGTSPVPACWSQSKAAIKNRHAVLSDWSTYWDRLQDHQAIFRAESQDYVRRLDEIVSLDRQTRALDFGCGFGFVANALAPKVGTVALWDASSNMRRRARLNVAHLTNIEFLNLSQPDSIDGGSFDLILVNSVVQYMSPEEFSGWLQRWRRMLVPGGRLVISDIVLPNYRFAADIVALIRFSARHGFLFHAVWEGWREFSSYSAVKRTRPLLRLSESEIGRIASAAGLNTQRWQNNLTFRTGRTTVFLADSAPVAAV